MGVELTSGEIHVLKQLLEIHINKKLWIINHKGESNGSKFNHTLADRLAIEEKILDKLKKAFIEMPAR